MFSRERERASSWPILPVPLWVYDTMRPVASAVPIFKDNWYRQHRLAVLWCTAVWAITVVRDSLPWRHNERDGVSNHQPLDYLLNRLFKAQIKEKNQSFASLAFVRGIHRWPVNSPHKGPVTRKMFPLDDVIMLLLSIWDIHVPDCKAIIWYMLSHGDQQSLKEHYISQIGK